MKDLVFARRRLLASTALAVLLWPARGLASGAENIAAWQADAGTPPEAARPGAWVYFTAAEALAIEAIVDRLIPADDVSVGGQAAGCAVFIDRQLAGGYGRAERLYMRPPFLAGTPQQGPQSPLTPAGMYRAGLKALDDFTEAAFIGKRFAELKIDQQDTVLAGLEKGTVTLDGVDAKSFFELLLQNTMEGFFADPIYGGNRDMVGWRVIGFPGARYDYRDYLDRFDAPYERPPVGLEGGPSWRGAL